MPRITPEEARLYLQRWALMNAHQAEELRRTPIGKKLRQLQTLMAARHLFPPDPQREAGVRQVRARWARLREALGG